MAVVLAACLMGGILPAAHGQAAPTSGKPAAFDPADVYFQGWLLCNDAEKLIQEGKHHEAVTKLRRASQLFDTIRRNFPDWKTDMVDARQRKTADMVADSLPQAMQEEERRKSAVAELEGGRVETVVPDDTPASGLAAPANTMTTRRIRELEQRALDLGKQLAESARGDKESNQLQRDQMMANLQKTRSELEQLRREETEGAMQGEVAALARRINKLEAQRDVMARALDQSKKEAERARSQVDALQNERARLLGQIGDLQQQVADAKRDAELERKTSNEVVAGQLKQIRQLQEVIQKKDAELADARKTIEHLGSELAQVRESYEGLRDERDELLRERDQMAALLKLNEAGQLQEVIDQNLALDRELRETKKRYEALKADNDAAAEDLTLALRDLSLAKLRIQEFRQVNEDQEKRLAQMKQRLQAEALGLDGHSVDDSEARMLRGILDRQMKVQEKREEARDILFAQLEKMSAEDPELKRAMDNFRGNELNLSKEELAIIDGQVVDGTIISPYARPRTDAERAYADLADELRPYDAAATRAYLENRPLAAREAWGMMIDRNPGDAATMCKLGLVERELGDEHGAADWFRRATELDPSNPYAFRMLGYFLDRFGQREEAVSALKQSIGLNPTDARTHQLLGNTLLRGGQTAEARDEYMAALDCDPTSAETHYNLAVLFRHTGKNKEAVEHYRTALELGLPANMEFEKTLDFSPLEADPTG